MIPEDIREILEPFLPEDVPWEDVVVSFHSLPQGVAAQGPRSMAAIGASNFRTVGLSMEGRMSLDPDYGDPGTAAGLALWAHELVHQEQIARIPNFMVQYMNEAWRTPPDMPWLNVYEEEAYRTERDVYCSLVEHGYPPGDWVPLSVQVRGCP